MAEKISLYVATAGSNPIKAADYLDFSNEDGGGGYDVSKKILVSEFLTFLNGQIVNIYNADGTLGGNRIITHSGNSLTHLGGDVIITMDEEITDYAYIIQDVSNSEVGRFGFDQVSDSGVMQLSNLVGMWYNANDGQIVIGGANPLANVSLDIQFPNDSTNPLAFYEDEPGGASIGANYTIQAGFNDDIGDRINNVAIHFRVDAAPTTGDVNLSMTLNSLMKLQYNNRVLIHPSPLTAAPVAFFEVRGELGVTNNTNFLSRANGDGTANEIFRGVNESGEIEFILSGNGRCQFNRSGNSGGDFQIEGVNDANLFYTDASADAIGIGTSTPNSQSIMEIVSTTKGFAIRPMTVAQAGAITPFNGLQVHVSDTDGTFPTIGLYSRENGAWVKL